VIRLRFSAVLFVGLLVPLQGQLHFQNTAEGKVVNEFGAPMANVSVTAIYQGAISGIMPSCWTQTDANGNFVIKGMLSGPNALYAIDTQAGYIDDRVAIFSHGQSEPARIDVSPGRPATGVVVTLRRGAKLKMSVVDAETAKPVPALVHITRPDMESDNWWNGNTNWTGSFEVVLPKVPFRIEVKNFDYETWRYSEMDSHGTEHFDLLLSPLDEKVLTIKLKKRPPEKSASAKPPP
jgi:hypothetical protein